MKLFWQPNFQNISNITKDILLLLLLLFLLLLLLVFMVLLLMLLLMLLLLLLFLIVLLMLWSTKLIFLIVWARKAITGRTRRLFMAHSNNWSWRLFLLYCFAFLDKKIYLKLCCINVYTCCCNFFWCMRFQWQIENFRKRNTLHCIFTMVIWNNPWFGLACLEITCIFQMRKCRLYLNAPFVCL